MAAELSLHFFTKMQLPRWSLLLTREIFFRGVEAYSEPSRIESR